MDNELASPFTLGLQMIRSSLHNYLSQVVGRCSCYDLLRPLQLVLIRCVGLSHLVNLSVSLVVGDLCVDCRHLCFRSGLGQS